MLVPGLTIRLPLCPNVSVCICRRLSASPHERLYSFSQGFSEAEKDSIRSSFTVQENFVSADEEQDLIKELDPHLKRHIYEKDHWDNAIVGFRETERKYFNKNNSVIVERLRKAVFPSEGKASRILPYTHILDLSAEGFIKPHIDSVRFCGDRVGILSLLSESIARLRLDKDRDKLVDVKIPRLSLYVMRGVSRYEYTHEILRNEESFFHGKHIEKGRRISIICRNEP